MAIPDEEVAQVRASTDLVALVGERAALKRQGTRWVGLCPFHAEKTPSFSVNAEAGVYYCFGCQTSGDAITFVRETERLDFADAVRWLADRAGITLHEDSSSGGDRRQRSELFEAMETAVRWYHERLLGASDAGRARDYLRSRGYDGELVRRFRLGWAPSDWDELSRESGLSSRALRDAGLSFLNRRGRLQDAFRNRVVFPICDPSGRPIALGGRILPPGQPGEPKYKNSPETPIYAKRRTLYGLNWAKEDIVASGEVVVCEGYTDVIGCFQAGIPRAVATCGTALAEEHFRLLRNFGRRIVLAYDADAAGRTAVERVYEWERRHEVDVAVAELPVGSDPGELAGSDPAALRRAVEGARPFLDFRVAQALDGPLESAEGRARAARRAIEVIGEHPDDLVRDQYLMSVADRCRLSPELLRQQLQEARRRGKQRPAGRAAGANGRTPAAGSRPMDPGAPHDQDPPPGRGPAARRGSPTGPRSRTGPGREALRFLVHRRQSVEELLDATLFEDPLERRAYEALVAETDLHRVLASERTDPELADLLRRLAVEEPVIPDEALGDPARAVVVQLVRSAAWRELRALERRARTEPDRWTEVNAALAELRLRLQDLDREESGNAAVGGLVAWLAAGDRQAEHG